MKEHQSAVVMVDSDKTYFVSLRGAEAFLVATKLDLLHSLLQLTEEDAANKAKQINYAVTEDMFQQEVMVKE